MRGRQLFALLGVLYGGRKQNYHFQQRHNISQLLSPAHDLPSSLRISHHLYKRKGNASNNIFILDMITIYEELNIYVQYVFTCPQIGIRPVVINNTMCIAILTHDSTLEKRKHRHVSLPTICIHVIHTNHPRESHPPARFRASI